ncbi:TPA: T3SS effector NleG family protein, partial [Escherichia coli]|nr:T3SS effector NleG family protein [Escherichia coli]
MPVMLNLSNGRMLPESELEALCNVASSNQSDILLAGGRRFRLHHILFMAGFSVEPIPGGFLERIGERRHRQLADNLERQLNGGSSFLQAFSLYMEQTRSASSLQESVRNEAQNRVNSFAFSVNPGEFSCGEQHLRCPITLSIPETGVFVKNAQCSNVSSLYDKNA